MDFRSGLVERNPEVFEKPDPEKKEKAATSFEHFINEKWGWVGFVYLLAEGDITHVDAVTGFPVEQALMWGAYKSDMAEVQKRKIQASSTAN